MSYGETLEEAYEMIKDAMQAWIAVQLEDGHEVPLPVASEYSGRFNVRIPRDLYKMLAEKAKDEGISLNAYVNFLLSFNNERYQALKEWLEDKDKIIEKLCT